MEPSRCQAIHLLVLFQQIKVGTKVLKADFTALARAFISTFADAIPQQIRGKELVEKPAKPF